MIVTDEFNGKRLITIYTCTYRQKIHSLNQKVELPLFTENSFCCSKTTDQLNYGFFSVYKFGIGSK